jgi:hypothetical protein
VGEEMPDEPAVGRSEEAGDLYMVDVCTALLQLAVSEMRCFFRMRGEGEGCEGEVGKGMGRMWAKKGEKTTSVRQKEKEIFLDRISWTQ